MKYIPNEFSSLRFIVAVKIVMADLHLIIKLIGLSFKKNNKKIKVLALNHFFDGEIDVLKKQLDINQYDLYSLSPKPAFTRGYLWFPMSVQNAEIKYDDQQLNAVKKRYRKYCKRLFQILNLFCGIDILITPSDSFFWIREFIKVANECGVCTIVADKEGMISPGNYTTGPRRIREYYPPLARYFFVWSERQKKFWMNAGVPEERVYVTGSLRTDTYINLHEFEERNSIFFFDFDDDAYLTDLDWENVVWQKKKSWIELRKSYQKVIYKKAVENPSIKFYIKSHPQQVVIDLYLPFENLANVVILRGGSKFLPHLLKDCLLVVGFQTTALLEAALMKIPVIYFANGDLFEAVKSMLLPWHKGELGILWVKSEEELEGAIDLQIANKTNLFQKNYSDEDMNEYFYRPDGNVGLRFIEKMNYVYRNI